MKGLPTIHSDRQGRGEWEGGWRSQELRKWAKSMWWAGNDEKQNNHQRLTNMKQHNATEKEDREERTEDFIIFIWPSVTSEVISQTSLSVIITIIIT